MSRPALVQLGRQIIESSRLDPAQAGTGDPELLAAVDQCERAGGFGEPFDADGWRVLKVDGEQAWAGAWSDLWSGWVVLRLRRERGTWSVQNSSYGLLPEPTPAEQGRGLRLRWPHDPIDVRRRDEWQLQVQLVNERNVPVDIHGDDMALGNLSQRGRALPTEPVFLAGTGLQVRLQPGQSITLPVTLFTRDLRNLPVGEYELHVDYRDLGLTAPVTTVRVR